jgi:ribulose-phosphate 3-epimerase
MIDVVPTILPRSFDDVSEHAARIHGLVPRMQIDIANASYAPTRTWPYLNDDHLSALVSQDEGLPFWEDVSYEVDMLIRKPEEALDNWIAAGVIGAVIHIESTEAHQAIYDKIRDADMELGWGIKPSTPNEILFALLEAHGLPGFVQCMGSDDIGRSGVELDPAVYEKIRAIRARYPELPLAIDIGVNLETAPLLVAAGATKLVAGTVIFQAPDIAEIVDELLSI